MEFGTSDGARQKRRAPATKQKELYKKNAMIESRNIHCRVLDLRAFSGARQHRARRRVPIRQELDFAFTAANTYE